MVLENLKNKIMNLETTVTKYKIRKYCCKEHRSTINVTLIECILGEAIIAKCTDCKRTIEGSQNVTNLVVSDNPLITTYILNKANLN